MVVFSLEKGPCNYQDLSGLYQLSCILSLSKKGIRGPQREKEKERNQGPKIKNWELPTLGEWGCSLNPRTRGKLRQTLQTKIKKILWFQRLRCNLYISLSLPFFFFFFFFFFFLGRKLHKRILAMDNHLLTSDACLNHLVPIQSWNSHWQRTISICDVVSLFCKISVYFFFFCKMGDKNCDEGPRDYEDNTL